MKVNISNIRDCFGCGVCASSCPKKIIAIDLNKNGFYEPRIVENVRSCNGCGICLDVCAFAHDSLALKSTVVKSWAAWSNDEDVRRKCSSGGIGFEIGKQLIEKGYSVVGCRYDIQEQRAKHYIATTVEELIPSIGSKYIQSFTEEALKHIDYRHGKYLVSGTPCQIDSFRRMIQKFKCEENFILMDFFCHCVPSMHAWKNYIKMLEPKIGRITYASWRNKFEYGWHDSWLMGLDGEKTSRPVNWHDSYNSLIKEKKSFIQSRKTQGDWFYKMFLGDHCLGPQCQYQCKYKYDRSSADIRIGDLWGPTYDKDEKGTSALVCFTDKGLDVISELNDVSLVEHPFAVIAEGQMKENAQASKDYNKVMWLYRHSIYPSRLFWTLFFDIPFYAQRINHHFRKLLSI